MGVDGILLRFSGHMPNSIEIILLLMFIYQLYGIHFNFDYFQGTQLYCFLQLFSRSWRQFLFLFMTPHWIFTILTVPSFLVNLMYDMQCEIARYLVLLSVMQQLFAIERYCLENICRTNRGCGRMNVVTKANNKTGLAKFNYVRYSYKTLYSTSKLLIYYQ